MKHVVIIFLLAMLSLPSLSQVASQYFYVSSYDRGHPNGIALYRLDYLSSKISKVHEFDSETNSDYLAISPNNKFLLSVAMDDDTDEGLITSFSINQETGELQYLDEEASGGKDPCYISISDNYFAVVAHYSSGNITVASLDPEGRIFEIVENIEHNGAGPDKDRQGEPHPHMSIYYPKGNYIFVPDLGLDRIMVYKLRDNGHLKVTDNPFGSVAGGAGPRHFALHPNYQFGYVVNELNSTVTAFSFSKKTNELKEIQTISSLTKPFEESNYLADVAVSPDGKFLYASNRGHDSISIFSIDQKTGQLTLIKTESCLGQWPRAFTIDPTGKFLIIANEHSDNLVLFHIDEETGLLKFAYETENFPAPKCIKFLN